MWCVVVAASDVNKIGSLGRINLLHVPDWNCTYLQRETMTQKSSDLLAALKKKDITFILGDDVASAIDTIEGAMGKCWTDARGSRRVARQMLEDNFVPDVVFYSPVKGDYVDVTYVPEDGEVLTKYLVFRPLTTIERQERLKKVETERSRNGHKRYLGTKRSRARRASRALRTAPIPTIDVAALPANTNEERFSAFLTPKKIRKFGIGDLSVG